MFDFVGIEEGRCFQVDIFGLPKDAAFVLEAKGGEGFVV